MSTLHTARPRRPSAHPARAGYQAFVLLRVAFAVAPMRSGVDKFFDV